MAIKNSGFATVYNPFSDIRKENIDILIIELNVEGLWTGYTKKLIKNELSTLYVYDLKLEGKRKLSSFTFIKSSNTTVIGAYISNFDYDEDIDLPSPMAFKDMLDKIVKNYSTHLRASNPSLPANIADARVGIVLSTNLESVTQPIMDSLNKVFRRTHFYKQFTK